MNDLLTLLSQGFMIRALLAGCLVALLCAVIGVFVVYRRMAFAGHALAHAAMPGLALAYLGGWNLLLGALVADLLTACGIAAVGRRRGISEDTAIGVVSTGVFACGLALLHGSRSFQDYDHLLFGSVLGVGSDDLLLITAVAALVGGVLWALRKELVLASYDEGYAAVVGFRPGLLRLVLLLLVALTVVAAVSLAGAVLTSALLVTPPATASLLCRRLRPLLWTSIGLALLATVGGILLSALVGLPPGPAIVLVAALAFVLASVAMRLRQILA